MGGATKVALVVFVILTVAALLGVKVFHLFGVSLDAFMVAGGCVLAWLGFAMLRGLPPGPPPAAANPSLAAEFKTNFTVFQYPMPGESFEISMPISSKRGSS